MKNNPAFTLLELIIVIVIIGILVFIGMVRYDIVLEKARSAEAYGVLTQISAAEKRYYLENDSFTTTLTDLDIYGTAPTSDHFTYSVPSADYPTGYAQAARKSGVILSYGLCLDSTKWAYCDADTCDPSCP